MTENRKVVSSITGGSGGSPRCTVDNVSNHMHKQRVAAFAHNSEREILGPVQPNPMAHGLARGKG